MRGADDVTESVQGWRMVPGWSRKRYWKLMVKLVTQLWETGSHGKNQIEAVDTWRVNVLLYIRASYALKNYQVQCRQSVFPKLVWIHSCQLVDEWKGEKGQEFSDLSYTNTLTGQVPTWCLKWEKQQEKQAEMAFEIRNPFSWHVEFEILWKKKQIGHVIKVVGGIVLSQRELSAMIEFLLLYELNDLL